MWDIHKEKIQKEKQISPKSHYVEIIILKFCIISFHDKL